MTAPRLFTDVVLQRAALLRRSHHAAEMPTILATQYRLVDCWLLRHDEIPRSYFTQPPPTAYFKRASLGDSRATFSCASSVPHFPFAFAMKF